MAGYKRYVNPKEPGQLCFVTATCLDFAHLFSREEMRTRMCISLLQDCRHNNASLYGYVVMTHHLHLIVRPNDNQTVSALVKQIKESASTKLYNLLQPSETAQLRMQDGLGRNQFWKRSFRGNPLYTPEVSRQKLNYLHENPVRAGFVVDAGDYQWSSLHVLRKGIIQDDESVDFKVAIQFYREKLGLV